jgi:protoporphyrinogen oxidase
MPIQELIRALDRPVPRLDAREVSDGLLYRDFITMGLLLKKLKIGSNAGAQRVIEDNWIYIRESDVLAGCLQIINNSSPYMVSDQSAYGWALNTFAMKPTSSWRKPDEEMAALAKEELDRIGIIDCNDVLDWSMIRMPKNLPHLFWELPPF